MEKAKILLVDDESDVTRILSKRLGRRGFECQTAANGQEAVDAMGQYVYGVIIMDVKMPVMDGMEALPQAVEISPETVIVMVTGCNDRQQIAQAAGLGAKGYILKPLRPAYVEGLVRKLFGARQG